MKFNKTIAKKLDHLNECEYYPMEDVGNVLLRLNINENFLIEGELLRRLAKEVLDEVDLRLYPNTENVELVKILSKYFSLGEDWFTIGCGEDQLIDILLNIFAPQNKVISIFPTFPVYRFRTIFNDGIFVEIPLNSNFSLNVDKLIQEGQYSNLILLCSPNNPTGNQFPLDEVEKIVSNVDSLVVIDEAYVDFAEYSIYPLTKKYENLIVLRTFSKSFGLAGLRIGYMIANPDISKPISTAAQLTYPVVSFSTRMAIKLFQNRKIVEDAVNSLKIEREKLYRNLRSIGIKAYESQANFIFFRSPIDPNKFYTGLKDKGIMIRDIGKIFDEHYFRVTVGTEEMNRIFLNTVKKIVQR
jgi:histidinol-phosphate aminotransferase